MPKLRNLDMPLALSIDFNGTGSRLNVNDLSISTADHGFVLKANAHVLHNRHTTWRAEVSKLFASGDAISRVYKLATSNELPAIVHNLGDVSLTAKADGTDADLSLNAVVGCAPGSVKLSASKQQKALHAHVETRNFALDKLLGTDKTGVVSLSVDAKGSSKDNVSASGSIYDICYNGYTYRNIDLKADYINKVLSGSMAIDDPNVRATIEGLFEPNHRAPHLRVNADVQTFVPSALKLTNKWNNAQFSVSTVCDIKGSNLNNAEGQVDISNFTMQNADSCYSIRNINVVTGFDNGNHFLNLKSDFGTIDLNGHFSYNSIARSVLNLIADKLPTIPGLEKKPQTEHNDFTVNAYIHNTEWLQKLLGVPLERRARRQAEQHRPVVRRAFVHVQRHQLSRRIRQHRVAGRHAEGRHTHKENIAKGQGACAETACRSVRQPSEHYDGVQERRPPLYAWRAERQHRLRQEREGRIDGVRRHS